LGHAGNFRQSRTSRDLATVQKFETEQKMNKTLIMKNLEKNV